jgi:hypothetical protein
VAKTWSADLPSGGFRQALFFDGPDCVPGGCVNFILDGDNTADLLVIPASEGFARLNVPAQLELPVGEFSCLLSNNCIVRIELVPRCIENRSVGAMPCIARAAHGAARHTGISASRY